jgi:hypothetical protein
MTTLMESRPPEVSVRAGCAALALSRASYYRQRQRAPQSHAASARYPS